jgi:alkanesulfonate monooxygenase SsuD/methylene tetrahydromethanopterin reductase-like flavin-dependent oxidoreductase (luciferase family)
MRFGLFIPGHWFDTAKPPRQLYHEMLAQAEYAEELGYDTVWLAEHHFLTYIASPDPLQLAAIIADRTSRIDIGFAVLISPFHHPLHLAGALAQLHLISGGRVRVGLGRGASQYEMRRMATYRDEEESREFYAEHLDVLVRALHEGGPHAHTGKYFNFDETTIIPQVVGEEKPLQLHLAANHPASVKWAVDTAARLGMEPRILFPPFRRPYEVVEEAYNVFIEQLEKNGQSRDEASFMVHQNCFVAESTTQAAELTVPLLYYQHRSVARMLLDEEHVHNGQVIGVPVDNEPTPDEMVRNLLIGDYDKVAERLHRYERLGVDEVNLYMALGVPHADTIRSMELFAEHVMPQFRPPPTRRPLPPPPLAESSLGAV